MPSREEVLKKYGIESGAAPISRDSVLKKYGITSEKDYEPSPVETALAALSPKNLTAGIYGAGEALEAPWGQKLAALKQGYKTGKEALESSEKTNPKSATAGKLVRGLLGGVAAGPSIAGMGALGSVEALGDTDANLSDLSNPQEREKLGKDVGTGAALGLVGGAAGEYIIPGVAKSLKDSASKFAVRATGATGKEASKFSPETGKELLKKGLVKFGDSPKKIASRIAEELEKGGTTDEILKPLSEKGVKISNDDLISAIRKKAESLSEDDSKRGVIKKLNSLADDLIPGKQRDILDIEKSKRGFQASSNYNKPIATEANKAAAQVYKDAVESAAAAENPELLERFLKSKKDYGLLSPVLDASERRAQQLSQSPLGGLLDVATSGAGQMASSGGGIIAPIARRVIAPRLASSTASSLNTGANLLESLSPQARRAIIGGLLSK